MKKLQLKTKLQEKLNNLNDEEMKKYIIYLTNRVKSLEKFKREVVESFYITAVCILLLFVFYLVYKFIDNIVIAITPF